MIAISSLLLIVAISLVVTRAATVLLVATGLSRQVARFQARSALTGSGFTTTESEDVVRHPLRRRVIMALMLLGNIGIVASAGSLILGFSRRSTGTAWTQVVELVAGMLALVFVSRSRVVDRCLTGAAARLLRRHSNFPQRDLGGLLQLTGNYSVTELAEREADWIAGRRLAELALRDEGVVVLGVTRHGGRYLGAPGGRYLGAPGGATEIRAGDLLVAYGREDVLEALDERPRGLDGDRQHDEAVTRQHQQERAESAGDQ
ncbi:MAG: TrkA C-terminal domain-containing protein [Acidimicrobiales bacterium]